MRKLLYVSVFIISIFSCCKNDINLNSSKHDLKFQKLASQWDEAIPLGNGMVGALIWKNNEKLRISLDRVDLWDLRPMDNLKKPEWNFKWVYEQWKKNNYNLVQDKFDAPYDRNPAPSKIPAGALEFDIKKLGEIEDVRLFVENGVCQVKWKNGTRLLCFVHPTKPIGWYRFEGVNGKLNTSLVPPTYSLKGDSKSENPVTGQDLRRLGYEKGDVKYEKNSIVYNQKGWGGFKYQIAVDWKEKRNVVEGCWSISSEFPAWEKQTQAEKWVVDEMKSGFVKGWYANIDWWNNFWQKSSICLPDKILEKQWYLEMYKLGAAARKGTPPISLQAVWTADNGKLPPWKGDFHHDLNTQLSYWPAYSGNHLMQEKAYLDWLWKYRSKFKKYTKQYFNTNGINVPGVTTLTGEPMGGWIQYSFGNTISAWLGQHFYLHWKYTKDRKFLQEKAYPWIKNVAIYLDEFSVRDENGMRKLPISSSPEINNNSRDAWFEKTTNFDLALIRFTFTKAAELAKELGYYKDAQKWSEILKEWPSFAVDDMEGFMVAPDFKYNQSHRHFSHLMAFHPLGLLDLANGEKDEKIIKNTLKNLAEKGTDWWTGYSYSWQGNLYARAFDGDKAAKALKTFATCFCSPNSFHLNGDQSATGKSKFTYRPFTLEGNFAFAAGIQEMLIQSHTGIVRLFPAVPDKWRDIAFKSLRAEGAFLISAERKNGKLNSVEIFSEKGGVICLKNSFVDGKFFSEKKVKAQDIIKINMKPGEKIVLSEK